MKYLKVLLGIGIGLMIFGIAYAAPTSRFDRTIIPETSNTYDLGSPTSSWKSIYTNIGSGNCLQAGVNGIIASAGAGCGGAGGSPGGSNTQIQYNNSNSFAGANLFYSSNLFGTNSSSPGSNFVVQGSSTLSTTIPIFTVASSSNAILLQVASNGLVTVENDLTVNGALTLGSALSVSNGGTGVTGFTAGEVLFGNGSTDITSSGSLFWDDGNTRLGIGTSTPQQTLVVTGSTTITSLGAGCVNSTALGGLFTAACGVGGGSASGTAGSIQFSDGASGFNADQGTFLWNNTNKLLGVGTSTPYARITLSASTTATGGINFGDATSNLYRSAASTLQTDAGSLLFNGAGVIRGTTMTVQGAGGGGANYQVTLSGNASQTYTSGTAGAARANSSFIPASGSGVFNTFDIQGTINQCAGCTGISRGLFVNPTAVTRAADYRALEVAAYTYNAAGTALATAYGSLFNPYTLASTTLKTVANAQMLTIGGAPIAGTNILITSSTALTVLSNNVTSSTTNAQGLWVEAPTGAANNYAALLFGGNVGIGTSTPGQTLTVVGNLQVTTKASCILGTDANGVFTCITRSSKIPILSANILPDTSGNVYVEPFTISSSTAYSKHATVVYRDSGTNTCAYGSFYVPTDFAGTNATITPVWAANATGNIVSEISYIARATDEAFDKSTADQTASSTKAMSSTLFGRTNGDIAITAANLAAQDVVNYRLCRLGADSNDTLAATATLQSLLFEYDK